MRPACRIGREGGFVHKKSIASAQEAAEADHYGFLHSLLRYYRLSEAPEALSDRELGVKLGHLARIRQMEAGSDAD